MSHNLIANATPTDFYVWVDPTSRFVAHQIQVAGSFLSADHPGLPGDHAETLMFLPNDKFQAVVSPFQNNLLRSYTAEYNLEVARQTWFSDYPSRLQATYLLLDVECAMQYLRLNSGHVGQRVLKHVRTVGDYRYSVHDSSWIEFMRLGGMMDTETLNNVTKSYWGGDAVEKCELESMGEAWTREPAWEVLFSGRVDFVNRTLDADVLD